MSREAIYGFPCVANPHDFSPDRDCCSPEEIATWERAKATWGTKDYQPNEGCYSEYDASGALVKHVTRTSWGIGVNFYAACDGCSEPGFCSDAGLMTCHECGGAEFCGVCWPKHEQRHEDGEPTP